MCPCALLSDLIASGVPSGVPMCLSLRFDNIWCAFWCALISQLKIGCVPSGVPCALVSYVIISGVPFGMPVCFSLKFVENNNKQSKVLFGYFVMLFGVLCVPPYKHSSPHQNILANVFSMEYHFQEWVECLYKKNLNKNIPLQ